MSSTNGPQETNGRESLRDGRQPDLPPPLPPLQVNGLASRLNRSTPEAVPQAGGQAGARFQFPSIQPLGLKPAAPRTPDTPVQGAIPIRSDEIIEIDPFAALDAGKRPPVPAISVPGPRSPGPSDQALAAAKEPIKPTPPAIPRTATTPVEEVEIEELTPIPLDADDVEVFTQEIEEPLGSPRVTRGWATVLALYLGLCGLFLGAAAGFWFGRYLSRQEAPTGEIQRLGAIPVGFEEPGQDIRVQPSLTEPGTGPVETQAEPAMPHPAVPDQEPTMEPGSAGVPLAALEPETAPALASATQPVGEGIREAGTALPPPFAQPPLATGAPAPEQDIGAIRPLVFDSTLWQPGNTWIFHHSRTMPEPASDFLDLQYYFERTLTDVQLHPWGCRLVFTDRGGIEPPRISEYIATASCLVDAQRSDILFCLPADEGQLAERQVSDIPARVLEVSSGSSSFTFDPRIGWITQSETARDGQHNESMLAGYRVGERTAGDIGRVIHTCDWTSVIESGTRLGNANRPRTPELQQAREWGLRGNVTRWQVPLGGLHGLASLTFWGDSNRTFYRLNETDSAVDVEGETDQPVERIDLALETIKLWSDPDGSAEYVLLVFDSRNTGMVDLLRIGEDREIETQTLLPPVEPQRLGAVLLAGENGCYVQIRNGYGPLRRYANFELSPDGVHRTAGDL